MNLIQRLLAAADEIDDCLRHEIPGSAAEIRRWKRLIEEAAAEVRESHRLIEMLAKSARPDGPED